MKPSLASKNISATKARNAALLNQFATPGLGSLMAGRWVAGTGQLILSLAGFVLIMVWFFKIIIPYYGLMFGETQPPPINWTVGGIGTAIFILSWCWSLVTSLSLTRGATKNDADALKLYGASLNKLDESGILSALASLPEWDRSGLLIARTYEFENFPAAMKFVNAVAALAEQVQHHPDMDVRWNRVTIAFTTHDAGGLTQKDFTLARACDQLASR